MIARMRLAPATPSWTSEKVEDRDEGREAQQAHQPHVGDRSPTESCPRDTSSTPWMKAPTSAIASSSGGR